MKIDIDQLNHFHSVGILKPDVGWGDAKETACLMSALTGETSIEGCAAQGWPEWLAHISDCPTERGCQQDTGAYAAFGRASDWRGWCSQVALMPWSGLSARNEPHVIM